MSNQQTPDQDSNVVVITNLVLAEKVLETLEAQQNYFKIARSGEMTTVRSEALKQSKLLERELKAMAIAVKEFYNPSNKQQSLF